MNNTRKEQKRIFIYLTAEDRVLFKTYCAKNDVTMQRLLEGYIQDTIRDKGDVI